MNIASQPSIFICEFITAGGFLGEPLPQSLVKEGLLMRDALIADLQPYANVVTTHDERLPPADGQSIAVNDANNINQIWEQQVQKADIVWIIAPETDGILYHLTSLADKYNKLVVGSTLDAIKITSSKLAMYTHLSQFNIPVVPTQTYENADLSTKCWLMKPDDGVGAEHVVVGDAELLKRYIETYHLDSEQFIVQPYLTGIPASISVFSYQQSLVILSYNLQDIVLNDNKIHYLGGKVNGAIQYQSLMDDLAAKVLSAIPGLQGYWGMDVMIEPNSEDITVIEINPRLTTSYIKLREAMAYNPAKLIIDTLVSGSLVLPDMQYKQVSFDV